MRAGAPRAVPRLLRPLIPSLRLPGVTEQARRHASTTAAVPVALGLDFGTESVRAVLVSLTGTEVGSAVRPFDHGVITTSLPGSGAALGPEHVAQHAGDWVECAGSAVREVLSDTGTAATSVVGIGVDFTSCTLLPTTKQGEPLQFYNHARPHAWPKLWKHHGAAAQAEELTAAALAAKVPWLEQYAGVIGSEWLLPKALEVFDEDRAIFDATEVFVEAGDWFVWQLVGGEAPPRSTCMAGYKSCWSAEAARIGGGAQREMRDGMCGGAMAERFLEGVRPGFGSALLEKLPGAALAPGEKAGELTEAGASLLGLRPGTAVASAIIDAHSGVPGAGVGQAGTLVMTMGTSGCYMLNAAVPADGRSPVSVPGAFGQVEGGILPGLIGYEMGQAAMGDAFAWLSQLTNTPLRELAARAAALPTATGQEELALDWINGCRSPHNDTTLRGVIGGVAMSTTPEALYRATAAGIACGGRDILESFTGAGVPVDRIVATGGLPHAAPDLIQTFADVRLGFSCPDSCATNHVLALVAPHPDFFAWHFAWQIWQMMQREIAIHPSTQGPAVGAAVLGGLASGEFASIQEAVASMATPASSGVVVEPRPESAGACDLLYARYAELAEQALKDKVACRRAK